MVYAIIDDLGEIIKIKTQLNHITACRRCYSESDNGDTSSVIAAVEINIIKSFPNNRTGVASIREFHKNKDKKVSKPGKNIPYSIIEGLL